jgi:hypothetical protein
MMSECMQGVIFVQCLSGQRTHTKPREMSSTGSCNFFECPFPNLVSHRRAVRARHGHCKDEDIPIRAGMLSKSVSIERISPRLSLLASSALLAPCLEASESLQSSLRPRPSNASLSPPPPPSSSPQSVQLETGLLDLGTYAQAINWPSSPNNAITGRLLCGAFLLRRCQGPESKKLQRQ